MTVVWNDATWEKRYSKPQAADETEERWGKTEVMEMLPSWPGRRKKSGRCGGGGWCLCVVLGTVSRASQETKTLQSTGERELLTKLMKVRMMCLSRANV